MKKATDPTLNTQDTSKHWNHKHVLKINWIFKARSFHSRESLKSGLLPILIDWLSS